MQIRVTDKVVTKGILVSLQARRNYLEQSKELALMVKEALPIFRKFLNFPKTIVVRIATHKGTYKGSYNNYQHTLFLNVCRFDYDEVMVTLAHELVHAEQFHEKRLKQKGSVMYWYDEKVKNKGSTYASYRKQPWEVEAFNRQKQLAKLVTKELEKKYEEDR